MLTMRLQYSLAGCVRRAAGRIRRPEADGLIGPGDAESVSFDIKRESNKGAQ